MRISHDDLMKLISRMGGAKRVEMRFQVRVALIRLRIAQGKETGTKTDYHYAKAGEVVYHSHLGDRLFVDIHYKGNEYHKVEVAWGPLDLDREKSTVLIREPNREWTKLWFYDKDIRTG